MYLHFRMGDDPIAQLQCQDRLLAALFLDHNPSTIRLKSVSRSIRISCPSPISCSALRCFLLLLCPANLDTSDTRSGPQRKADALTDICRFFLDHNDSVETSGGEQPHITVTVDYRILSGELERLPEIGGVAVDPESLRRLTCDAAIIPMVLGSESEVLDVGRKTRTIPGAVRRALEQRDGGCTWRGCTAPTSWTDAHHIVHWADGGETALYNLVLLCRRHHTATHEGKSPPDR